MNAEELHRRASRLLADALEREEQERADFLRASCGDEPELLSEVLDLLAHAHEGEDDIRPLWDGEQLDIDAALGKEDSPEWIGPYRILTELGRGGSGVVYAAERRQPTRRVALKVLLWGGESAERLEREAEILAALDHPGIARLYELGWDDPGKRSRPFLAMEFVRGEALDRHATRHELDTHSRVELVLEVCYALEHAHCQRVFHLDLKPDNILVDAEGRPRLIDFGIARAAGADFSVTTLRIGSQHVVGTLPYMSPEQACGRGSDLGAHSDVYSLGVTLYHLLTGELPHEFGGLGPGEARLIVQEEPAKRLRAKSHGIPRDLARIVDKAIEHEPKQRYLTCRELADDLRRFLNEEPVLACPTSAMYRTRRFVARHRSLVTIVASLLIALAVAAGASFYGLMQARRVLHLADHQRLESLRERAEALWPAGPELIVDYEQWLVEANDLHERLSTHTRELARIREEADSTEGVRGESGWIFADEQTRWWHDQLAELVDELNLFFGPDPHLSTVASVSQRLTRARTLRDESLVRVRSAWERAIASVADESECPQYAGLVIEPQLGLVPLGRDPASRLWEFAHLLTGEVPAFDDQTGVHIEAASGVVLVLIPGCTGWIGAQPTDPNQPNYDPAALYPEASPTYLDLDPFFMSKYETTRAQWIRLIGTDTAYYSGRLEDERHDFSNLHPMENISWHEARRFCMQVGLELPSEARWELCARAGTSSHWWFGDDRSSLVTYANISDGSVLEGRSNIVPSEDDLEDGFVIHASAGSFLPDPQGLHDMYGNVAEWTRDRRPYFGRDFTSNRGDALVLAARDRGVARGGSFLGMASDSRSSSRRILALTDRSDDLGFRTCRDLVGFRPALDADHEGKSGSLVLE